MPLCGLFVYVFVEGVERFGDLEEVDVPGPSRHHKLFSDDDHGLAHDGVERAGFGNFYSINHPPFAE